MSQSPSARKKITNFNDFKSQASAGALGNAVEDLDIVDKPAASQKPATLDDFLGIKKGGNKRLEDDVSEDSSMDDNIREIIVTNKKLNSDELFAVNAALYKWQVAIQFHWAYPTRM